MIRTRDRKAFLQQAVASVLAQTYAPIEIVIVNDGGEDFSALFGDLELNPGRSLRWINNAGTNGRSHAANLAMTEAGGDWMMFLDDDDWLDPGHIAGLMSALLANPGYQAAYSAVRTVTNGKPEDEPSFRFDYDPVRLLIENTIPIHAVLFSRRLPEAGCRFDPAFDRFEDWDFWLQVSGQTDFLFLDDCTANYRIDTGSGFGAKDEEDLDTFRKAIYKKWLPRLRDDQLLALFDRSRDFPQIAVLENARHELHDSVQVLQFRNETMRTELDERAASLRKSKENLERVKKMSEERIGERDKTIKAQQKSLALNHALLKDTREALSDAEKRLVITEAQLKEEQETKQEMHERLETIYASKSWKLTRPLRFFNWLVYHLRHEGVGSAWHKFRDRFKDDPEQETLITPDFPVNELYHPLTFNLPDEPNVSIVIPVFNQYKYTFHCLKSILQNSQGQSYEVIVVDDCSSDETAQMLGKMTGIRVIRNAENSGFIHSCNTGASNARGEFLLLLNNDTEVREGWLQALLDTFGYFPDAGMVGARLVFPDGSLQEAGGIVWRDGSAWNYGRGNDPNMPEYAYARAVDYCSGACLMIRLADYESLGGFDTRYAPAYYEDTDLAFRVREMGKRVYYQPCSTIIHFEGKTSGTDTGSGVKQFQVVNHGRFYDRWRVVLENHRPNGRNPYSEKERHVKKRALVIDARVLMPDNDSGSLRMFNLLRILQNLDYKVSFLPDNLQYHDRYTPMMQARGMECFYVPYVQSVGQFLYDYGEQFDVVIVSRADYAEKHIDAVIEYCPNAKVLFDTVDLHFLREQRQAELSGNPDEIEAALVRKEQELAIARKADVTLVVSPVELEMFGQEAPDVHVGLLSNIHQTYPSDKGFAERKDILFIGSFEHPPNVDAMIYFIEEVFPLVLAENPAIKLLIAGKDASEELTARENDSVHFLGFVPEIGPLFDGVRLSIAPLRYGAGVKGKVNSSMAHGVPVVASTIAAEGMNLEHEKDVLIADEPADFARQILRLYEDESLWQTLSAAGLKNIEQCFSFELAEKQLREVLPD